MPLPLADRSEETTEVDLRRPAEAPTAVEVPFRRPGVRRALPVFALGFVALALTGGLVVRRLLRDEAPEAVRALRRESPAPAPPRAAPPVDTVAPEPPPAAPPATAEPVDFTDRAIVARLTGRWRVETALGPEVVAFTATEMEVRRDGPAVVRLYGAASSTYPPLYTAVRLPDGGNFLAFWTDGDYGEVWEDLAFEGRDTLTFRPLGSELRHVAERIGDLAPRGGRKGREATRRRRW